MRLRCYLKDIRGPRKLREISRACGVNAGELSMIESGKMVPKDRDIPALVAAYGAEFWLWYHPLVLVALEPEDEPHAELLALLHRPPSPGPLPPAQKISGHVELE